AVCPKSKYLAYSYAPHDETKPYFDMAHQYVLGDEMYASDFDISSFVSHQYIIAGVNPDSSVDYPYGDWGCTGGPSDEIPILLKDRKWLNDQHQAIKTERPCWKLKTLGDELDAKKKMSWSFYAAPVSSVSPKYACGHRREDEADSGSGSASSWSAYAAVSHICYGADWNDDVKPFSPPSKFLKDIAGGELRAVTWITPTCADSDHAGCNGNAPPTAGPSWVASVVNAIGHSKYWDSCAIFVFWDDPGGWYDPEPPQYLKDSDYDGLGYRLPLLIISPYAKKGHVDHTHYEHGTILKFVENVFGLKRLNEPDGSDVRANPPDDAFDFSQAPRKFVTIKAPLNANYFIHERLDGQPPDSD
ncbi:MAG: alkaline phosphatase family protein, partial [Candidatus Cybelea sp.]